MAAAVEACGIVVIVSVEVTHRQRGRRRRMIKGETVWMPEGVSRAGQTGEKHV